MIPPLKHPLPPRAFSLVETVLALAIASGATLALVALIPSGLDQIRLANRDAASARIVQYVNAYYQMRPWADILIQEAGGVGRVFYFDVQGAWLAEDNSFSSFGAQVTVLPPRNLPGAPDTNTRLRPIEVLISDHIHAQQPFKLGIGVRSYQLLIAQTDNTP